VSAEGFEPTCDQTTVSTGYEPEPICGLKLNNTSTKIGIFQIYSVGTYRLLYYILNHTRQT